MVLIYFLAYIHLKRESKYQVLYTILMSLNSQAVSQHKQLLANNKEVIMQEKHRYDNTYK